MRFVGMSIFPRFSMATAWANLHRSGGILLAIRAKPTGKRNRIVNVSGPALEVELAAKPQNGEANAELVDYISNILRVKKRDLQLICGEKSRDKQLLLQSGLLDIEKVKQLIDLELNS
jgi:uncharacterized protein (TIGR00251 family)